VVAYNNRIEPNCPRRLNRVLTEKSAPVACHGIAQQTLVRISLHGWVILQIELALFAHEALPSHLTRAGERDGGLGGNPETQIIGSSLRRI